MEDNLDKNKENPFINLIINIILPSVILTKLSSDKYLGTVFAIILALSFPFIFGILGLFKNKKVNFISIIGLVSILLTASFTLLSLDVKWIAIKEAAIPFFIGIFILISLKTPFPIVRKLILNDQIFNLSLINNKLTDNYNVDKFDKRIIISTFMLAGSFFVSSILNKVLANIMLKSLPGTTAFNEELGKMTAFSFPVITIPSMLIILLIFFYVFKSIRSLTGLDTNEILAENLSK